MIRKLLGVLIAGLFLVASQAGGVTEHQLMIGTGGVTGVYYPTGGALSKLVNEGRGTHGITLTAATTGGSVWNVDALMKGEIDLGIVQSDLQFQAYNGSGKWEGNPQPGLRALFSLHPEAVTIIARADLNIERLEDLKGRTVNIGEVGSGQRVNATDLLREAGIDPAKDLNLFDGPPSGMSGTLEAGLIDAYFYTVGHPNTSVREATTGRRPVRFIPVDQKLVNRLVKEQPYYAPATIPVESYPGTKNTSDVPTFGVKATVCTTTMLSDEVAYTIVKEVFEKVKRLRRLHPALFQLTPESMVQGLSAPLHPGAERYFKEAGLLK